MGKHLEFIDPYDKSCANLFIRAEHLARYLYAADFIGKNRVSEALDCACGDGYGCRVLAKRAQAVTGVDANPELIQTGKSKDEAFHIQNIHYQAADLNSGLGMFPDASFGCITCFETLEHIEKDEELLREFRRVLRRGGQLLLSVPKAGHEPVGEAGKPENPYHIRLYTVDGIKSKLEKNGLKIERHFGQPFSNAARRRMENYKRDTGTSQETVDRYFNESPESLEFYARVWGWPEEDVSEMSNVIFMICK